MPSVAVEGMTANVVSKQFLLVFEHLQLRPGFDGGIHDRSLRWHHWHVSKKGDLSAGAITLLRGRRGHRGLDLRKKLSATFPKAIKGAALHQAFQDFSVHGSGIQAGAERIEGCKFSALVAFGNRRFHRAGTDVLDRGQSEANSVARGFWRKFEIAGIDVRWTNGDFHAAAFADHLSESFGRACVKGEHRGHELAGIVGLQIRRLIRNPAVGGAVGFIESVFGEFRDEPENGISDLGSDVIVLLATSHKAGALFFHLFGILLAHRAAEKIGLAERVASQHACCELDLFLINNDAVGFRANLLEEGVQVFDFFETLLALDIFRNELHRTRTIKRANGDDVFDAADIESFAATGDAATLHLENAQRFTPIVDIKSGFVVRGNGIDVEIGIRNVNESHGFLHDRERAKPQEIHLQHP